MTTTLNQPQSKSVITSLADADKLMVYQGGSNTAVATSLALLRSTIGRQTARIKTPSATTYFAPYGASTTNSTGAVTANLIYAYLVLEDVSIAALSTEVTTLLAGAGVAGIYSPDTDSASANYRLPKTLRLTGAVIDTSTAAVKDFTLATTVRAGEWIVMNLSVAVTLRTMNISGAILNPILGTASPSASTGRSYVTGPYTYDGTLPSAFPTITVASAGTVPGLYMKAA